MKEYIFTPFDTTTFDRYGNPRNGNGCMWKAFAYNEINEFLLACPTTLQVGNVRGWIFLERQLIKRNQTWQAQEYKDCSYWCSWDTDILLGFNYTGTFLWQQHPLCWNCEFVFFWSFDFWLEMHELRRVREHCCIQFRLILMMSLLLWSSDKGVPFIFFMTNHQRLQCQSEVKEAHVKKNNTSIFFFCILVFSIQIQLGACWFTSGVESPFLE